jgi:hypothetical protein
MRGVAHCLAGCALGDIAAMALVPIVWPSVPTLVLMAIAIAAGLVTSLTLETALLRWREGFAWRPAVSAALRMSLLSMVAMEIAMNVVDLLVMGGQRMPISHMGFWTAWVPALMAGFVVPLPYAYWRLRRHGQSCH